MSNDNQENKDPVTGLIDPSRHAVAAAGAMQSDGRITPTLGKPNKSNWFMSHPEWQMTLTIAEGTVGAGTQARKRLYLVQGIDDITHERLVEGLDVVYSARCVLTCTTNEHYSVWPIKLSTDENIHIAHETSNNAWRASQEGFIKMRYVDNSVGYVWKVPAKPELYEDKQPKWPEGQPFIDILNKAFKNNVISDEEHPVYKSAIGGHI